MSFPVNLDDPLVQQTLRYGVLAPALVSAAVVGSSAVLAVAWWLWRHKPTTGISAWSAAVAIGAGYLVGHAEIIGWPVFPPGETKEIVPRLWYFAAVALWLGALAGWEALPFWSRAQLYTPVWLVMLWWLSTTTNQENWVQGNDLTLLTILILAGVLFWAALDRLARQQNAASLPLTLVLAAFGSVAVLHFAGSNNMARMAIILGAALVPVVARACFKPALSMRCAVVPSAVILSGLWLLSYFLAEPRIISLILLALASLASGLGYLPGVRKLAGWLRTGLSALTAAALVATAVYLAQPEEREKPEGSDLYSMIRSN
jgi:hypothetical protein